MRGRTVPRLLVLSTVHGADDTRIREKLIRSLVGIASLTYATKGPPPVDRNGFMWTELIGGRLRRNLAAFRLLLSRRFDAAVVHDPELIPASMVAAVLGRRIVIDVHEDIPGLFATRAWVPGPLRRPLAIAAAALLRLAERVCLITLAEPGYQRLFRRRHPVFANYPDDLPDPGGGGDSIVYVGDVTAARGLTDLAAALDLMEHPVPVTIVGRVAPEVAPHLDLDDDITVLGRRPHPEAMAVVGAAGVGVSPLRDTPNARYSLPTKTIEYLAMGIPVVATDLPGTTEAIGDLPGVVIVQPGDPVSLAAGLDRAMTDSSIGDAAATHAGDVRDRFRWPTDEVVMFYRSVLEQT